MDALEQDQRDLAALLDGDTAFAAVAVLVEEKGDIETDILQALGTLNTKAGKLGVLAVVLQPEELPTDPDTPNPEVRVRLSVQVFDQPLLNDTGTDLWAVCRRVRQLGHRRSFGRGLYSWAGTIAAPQDDASRRSRIVIFEARGQEARLTRLGAPLIDPEEGGAVPQVVTLTPPAGATVWYTLDGSYPSPLNEAAREYLAALTITEPCTLRAIAYQAGADPSNIAEAVFT